MRRSPFTLGTLTLLVLSASAWAQDFTETFDNGHNEGDFEVWFDFYNSIESTGGNPDWYLRLDNTAGSLTCHYVDIFQNTWPNAFSGDYRAMNVQQLGLDVNVASGEYGGQWRVTLSNDGGTPGSGLTDVADDLHVRLVSFQSPPLVPGWESFDFPIPSASTSLPADWIVVGDCGGLSDDDCWNFVMQDVDYVTFRLDTNPFTVGCFFTAWDMGVDNIRVRTGLSAENFCISVPNSTGFPALISGSGSNSVADNDLVLQAEPVPNQPGLFFYGPDQIQIPFGNGFRCVSGTVGRLDVLSPVSGTFTFAVDLTMPPSIATQITAGSTWNFQSWYRDPLAGGAFFNLSDGLEIAFTP